MTKGKGMLIFIERELGVPKAYQYDDELELSLYPKVWSAEITGSCVIGMSLPEQNDLMSGGNAVSLLLWHRRAALAACLEDPSADKAGILRTTEQFLAVALTTSKFPRKNARATIATPRAVDFEYTSFDTASFAKHMGDVAAEIEQLLKRNRFSDIQLWQPEEEEGGAAIDFSSGEIYEVPFDADRKTLEDLQDERALLTGLEIRQR